ncbi:hypothetical protein [Bacillus sp. 2205SS5-2]|uniref:hypothetical protein n=1 Tax=Bacillus sp. 2205SS5-2 TaxID=3109031 RepID=UPI003006426B
MKQTLANKDVLAVLLVSLVCAALLYASFAFFYQPQKEALQTVELKIDNEEKLVTVLESKVKDIQKQAFEDTTSLQKKVPVKPLTEQLLLHFEKAEILSDSFIEQIEFTDGDVSDGVNIENDIQIEEVDEASIQKEAVEVTVLPKGLKKLSSTLTVQSKTYFDLEKFITVLENLDRILEIESITFDGGGEIISIDNNMEFVSYNVMVSAFYLPGLLDLSKELPRLDTPMPSGKSNPFSAFPSREDEEEDGE